MKNSNHGMTMPELLITCMIMGLALTSIYGVFFFGINISNKLKARNEQQQSSLIFISRIATELTKSELSGLSIYYPSGNPSTGDMEIAFITPVDLTGNYIKDPNTDKPIYQAHMIYYFDTGDKSIKKIRKPLATPTEDITSLNQTEISNAIGTLTSQTVIKNAKTFQFLNFYTGNPDSIATNPMKFKISVITKKQEIVEFPFTVKIP